MNTINWSKRILPVVLVLVGLVAGFVLGQVERSPQVAESALYDGKNNQVIEMLAAVDKTNPVRVYSEATTSSQLVDELLWGDRVLARGVETTDTAGNRWLYVSLAEGVSGWIIANTQDYVNGRMEISTAVYTTPGLNVGSNVTVTAEGAGANLRSAPSVRAERLRALQAGEVLTVIGGPYQNEYFIWWRYRDASGAEGWVVDIQRWFTVQ